MRSTAVCCCFASISLVVSSLFGCGSDSGRPAGPPSPFAERFSQAEAMPDGPAKNDTFVQIAKDAANAGDVDAAQTALFRINDPMLREKTAYKAALAIGKAGKKREAPQLLKPIRDRGLLQKAQSKIANSDWSE